MTGFRLRNAVLVLGAVVVIAASAGTARVIWERSALASAESVGLNRLDLVTRSLRDAIAREASFPLVMARDPDVHAALRAPDDSQSVGHLNAKLAEFTAASDSAALYVIGMDGTTLSASNWGTPDSFVGQNYGFRTYFTRAIEAGTGSYFGIGVTTGRAGYFMSRVITDPEPIGVAVAKIEFYDLEASWEQTSEHIMVTEENGIVLLSSRPEWKYRALYPISEAAAAYIASTRQFEGSDLSPLGMEPRGDDPAHVWVEGLDSGATFLSQSFPLPELGWTVHQFTALAHVADARRDGTLIGATGSALIIAILFFLYQRHQRFASERRARAELEHRVAERTQELSTANSSLEAEIEERRRTETELRTTQNELIQAGKLAALGQMSAAIAHEINQPLTAIRTYVATTRVFVPLGDKDSVIGNLDIIDGLAVRMARITSHLKTFARKGGLEPPEPISVSSAVERAVDLIGVQAKTSDIAISVEIAPVWTKGNDVRLEQVVVNLVRNAMDAVQETEDPKIHVRVKRADKRVLIIVRDNGPGFTPEVLDTLFDPFVTTKPSGAGLGLGLTISSEIVRDFGGRITARNHPEGGAELTVDLPVATPAQQRHTAPA